MTAPERIWLQFADDEDDLYAKTTWAQNRINDKDIEYVRVDFIDNETKLQIPIQRTNNDSTKITQEARSRE